MTSDNQKAPAVEINLQPQTLTFKTLFDLYFKYKPYYEYIIDKGLGDHFGKMDGFRGRYCLEFSRFFMRVFDKYKVDFHNLEFYLFEAPGDWDELRKLYDEDPFEKNLLAAAQEGIKSRTGLKGFFTNDPGTMEVLAGLKRLADFGRLKEILILGETGVGKELLAKHLHTLRHHLQDNVPDTTPFVIVNCAAISDSVAESELFGHTKGAFTGAIKDKKGKFELAHGGSLFLDEVGNLSRDIQDKLLRAVEEKEICPVGGEKSIKVDAYLIYATNKNLREMVERGEFIRDLYTRISRNPIYIKPLRDRVADDFYLLAMHFHSEWVKSGSLINHPLVLEPAMIEILRANYAWRGNVRQYASVINSLLGKSLAAKKIIDAEMIRETAEEHGVEPFAAAGRSWKDWGTDERKLKIQVLLMAGKNKTEIAKILGITRPTLDRCLKL